MLQEYLNLKKRYKSYNTALTNAGIRIHELIPTPTPDIIELDFSEFTI